MVNGLRVKIFADGADLATIRRLADNPLVAGFTTNPTLMRQSGVTDYKDFAKEALSIVGDKPISFEVFADDLSEMQDQASEISSWGKNVYVKIPVTNTKGHTTADLIHVLSRDSIKLNVTALMTLDQVDLVAIDLYPETPAIISVFAGRIADTGRDPLTVMCPALEVLKRRPKTELLWASPRETLNIYQADECGCHIITVTEDQLKKLSLRDKPLDEYSLETVQMFHRDAVAAGYTL